MCPSARALMRIGCAANASCRLWRDADRETGNRITPPERESVHFSWLRPVDRGRNGDLSLRSAHAWRIPPLLEQFSTGGRPAWLSQRAAAKSLIVGHGERIAVVWHCVTRSISPAPNARSLSPQLRIREPRLPQTACRFQWPRRYAQHTPASPERAHLCLRAQT